MALSLLCDEHIPYPIIEGLRRRGLNVVSNSYNILLGVN